MRLRSTLPLLIALLPACFSNESGTGVSGDPGGCVGEGCSHGSTVNAGGHGGGSSGASSGGASSGGASSGGASSGGASSGAGSSTSGAGASSGGSSGSGSSSGGSTGGASSASTGSSSGGNGGGTGNFCMGFPLPDAGGCANGSFASQAVDILTCSPLGNATVQAIDGNAVPLTGSVNTNSDGTFVLCDPTPAAFTPYISAPSNTTTYFPELQGGVHSSLAYAIVASTNDLGEIAQFLPGGINPAQGTIYAHFNSSTSCPDPSGWTLGLTAADGGELPDGSFLEVYQDPSSIPDPTRTTTSTAGGAFFYDIDLSATNFFTVTHSKPDAGICAPKFTTAFYTGRLYVTANAISEELYQVQP